MNMPSLIGRINEQEADSSFDNKFERFVNLVNNVPYSSYNYQPGDKKMIKKWNLKLAACVLIIVLAITPALVLAQGDGKGVKGGQRAGQGAAGAAGAAGKGAAGGLTAAGIAGIAGVSVATIVVLAEATDTDTTSEHP